MIAFKRLIEIAPNVTLFLQKIVGLAIIVYFNLIKKAKLLIANGSLQKFHEPHQAH